MNFPKLIMFMVFISLSNMNFAQFNNIHADKSPKTLRIVQIDQTKISTLIFFEYLNNEINSDPYRIIYIGDKTHLINPQTKRKYNLLNSINLPLSDEGEPKFHILDSVRSVHRFCLEFERLPDSVLKFDLIEDLNNQTAFNFFGVTVDVDKRNSFIDISDFIVSTPVKEYGQRVKDGNLISYYKHKGVFIAVSLYLDNSYGKYYSAWINIQNSSGKNLLIVPDRITARTEVKQKNEFKDLDVITYNDYIKKVNNAQAWQNFAVAFGNSLAASNAGYSYSTTNSTYTGITNTFGSSSGYSGAKYGFSSDWASSSYSTIYGRSYTESYNGAAAYSAQQNSIAQTNAYISNQNQIKNRISEGYLKHNTISNQTDYTGFLNIRYIKCDNIEIEIPINGETYLFTFDFSSNK